MADRFKIAIGIPAYNDAATIEQLARDSAAVLSGISPDYEIVIINDGSKDHTAEVLRKITQTIPRTRAVEHPQNYGFGRTIQEAYVLPEAEWVFFIPGDGQIPPSELLKLYPHREKYDFILGHRVHRNDPPMRKINSFCYNLTVSLLAGRRIRDVNSVGLIRRSILEGVRFRSASAFIHAEILLEVVRKGGRTAELPIEHKARTHGRASGNKWRVIFATVRDMLQYFFGG